ncbi:6-phosphogluconate dehydrogenase [Calycina marina]|uniref:6-phosphogluconate dehydrogenase n=1 Tax=Calycina marina TaxID=1763456 RepID=A0A9P7YXM5_9HELO|nr:6-phosphogluconate dehydrogenase [Calycina marina]
MLTVSSLGNPMPNDYTYNEHHFVPSQPKVCIIGAGPAGFALAADLKSRGTDVLIYSHPTHHRQASYVLDKGYLKAKGKITSTATPDVTYDISEAVSFTKVIILSVPSTGQETILEALKSFDLRGHTIVAIPGNLFSLVPKVGLEVENIFETNLSPYSCRMHEGELIVLGKKKLIYIGSLHANLSTHSQTQIQHIFPVEVKWCHNIIEVCLSNINGVFHPLMMLMSAGRIESTAGDFMIYADGLTQSVANAMLAVDSVRIAIGAAFGFELKGVVEVSNECYGHDFKDLVDLAQNSGPHNNLKAPPDMGHRNISEDVPDLLVCWYGLAEKLGVEASPIKAVITLVEMATGRDYMEAGRNMRKLNLEHLSRNELLDRFGVGKSKLCI